MIPPTPTFARLRAFAALPCLGVALALCGACSRSPESTNAERDPTSARSGKPIRFAGRVSLTGDLARVSEGSLFLIVRPLGSRIPVLTRKYEIGDPAFRPGDGERLLHFSLDERDDVGGAAAQMADEMELEARYDPDGVVDTADGVVKTSMRVHPGDQELSIALPSDSDGVTARKDS